MFFYQDIICPVCGQSFHEGEDIVSCPVCGLPHHRNCWKVENRCKLEHLHGTEEQWSREKAVKTETPPQPAPKETVRRRICPHCQAENPEFAEFCGRCGKSMEPDAPQEQKNYSEYQPFRAPFPFAEAFSPQEWIGRHQAKDLAAIVGNNVPYYLPKFRQINRGDSGGWNWAAFLLGPYWLLYRKNYLAGILLVVIQTIYELACGVIYAPLMNTSNTADMYSVLENLMENPTFRLMQIPIFLLFGVLIASHILLGVLGNRLYFRNCNKRLDKLKQSGAALLPAEIMSHGGVSMVAAVIAYLIPYVISYIQAILQL